MSTRGFDHPLYILPFDHRESFETQMFGWSGALSRQQIAAVAAVKRVIYDGLQAAVRSGVSKQHAGILVDEQFGAAILRDATASGYMTACPTERSGQVEFDFEYGDEFAAHIAEFRPTFSKVLVRYNPEGDRAVNERQIRRLRTLSDYLHRRSRSRFMFELLVPPEPHQLDHAAGDRSVYDLELRPGLMLESIEHLQDAGIEPDVWKVEGLDRRQDCENVVAKARRGGRAHVGCIVLGRAESDQKVHEWLTVAAGVPGFIGFAVGRTCFSPPLLDLRAKQISREAAVARIARRYQEFVETFEATCTTMASLPMLEC